MANRREVLAALAAGAAALPAAGLAQEVKVANLAQADTPVESSDEKTCVCCAGDSTGLGQVPSSPNYFPNVPVETHLGQRALFFSDLLKKKIVLVNFMSIENDAKYPVTKNLTKVAELLGDRLAKDVFMYSITIDPENDSAKLLQQFALAQGAEHPGWLFLTGNSKSVEMIKGRFFASRGGHQHHHGENGHDCSMGLVRYGNVATGTWGSVAAKADPLQIADRINWITPRTLSKGPAKRRGPHPIIRSPHQSVVKPS